MTAAAVTAVLPGLEASTAEELASLDRLIADVRAKMRAGGAMGDDRFYRGCKRELARLRGLRDALEGTRQASLL